MAEDKADITKMDHVELMKTLSANPKVEINSATLIVVLREFHKYLEKVYGLKEIES